MDPGSGVGALAFLGTAAALLGLAAVVGMALAGIRLAGEPYPPAALAMLHGLLAGAALTLLIFAAVTVGIGALGLWAVGALGAAAGIGVWLNLGFHARQRSLPMRPMVAHILIAVVGVALLLGALIARHG